MTADREARARAAMDHSERRAKRVQTLVSCLEDFAAPYHDTAEDLLNCIKSDRATLDRHYGPHECLNGARMHGLWFCDEVQPILDHWAPEECGEPMGSCYCGGCVL